MTHGEPPPSDAGPRGTLTLRDQDELFGLLTEHANDFIRLHDLEGRSIYGTRSVEHLYGRQPATLFEFAHPDDRDECQRWWERILTGESERFFWRIRDARGDARWLETSASVIPFRGRPHVLTVCRDVTDRRLAIEELRSSHQDFATLAEKSLQAIVIYQDGRVVYANPASFALYGYTAEELKDMSYDQLLRTTHPLNQGRADERARPREAGEPLSPPVELPIQRKDGATRWIQAFTNIIELRGQPAILSTSIDITERKQAEEARLAAEQRLRHVVASSPAVLFVLPIENGVFGGISWMSANVEAILGYLVPETIGVDWWMKNIHADDRDSIVSQFSSEILSRDHCASEYRFRHRDGSYRWIRGETRLLCDAAGQPVEVVGSLSDITERKGLEEQFRQAQKMEAVGILAGGVAHDFNNLLTIISGYSEMLLAGLPPADRRREMASQIRGAAERGAGLTRQLLAFSSQTVLEPKVIDLNLVVRENEKMLRRIIGDDIQLTTALAPSLECVKIDAGQVSHVILNLAVNARDAMPKGGRLTVGTDNVQLDETAAAVISGARPGRYVQLAVTDTGTGMTPEVKAHLFMPFFTTKGPGRGTGLGLAMVYGIVKQSDGFICLSSDPGRGTTFKIYFPVVTEPVSPAKSVSPVNSLTHGNETILVVEDEDGVRSMIVLLLRQAGYTVLEASRGAEALQLAGKQAGPIHLLITDVVMPEMGGRDVAERLVRERPALKVLYLSGYTDDAIVRHGVSQAEVAFLQKPFTMAGLTNKVREVLDSSPA